MKMQIRLSPLPSLFPNGFDDRPSKEEEERGRKKEPSFKSPPRPLLHLNEGIIPPAQPFPDELFFSCFGTYSYLGRASWH